MVSIEQENISSNDQAVRTTNIINSTGQRFKNILDAKNEKLREKTFQQIADGKHAFVGSANNLKRVANGTHPSQIKKNCPHCGKTCDTANYSKWHGDNCKVLKSE